LSKPIISFLPINPYYFYSNEKIERTNRPNLNQIDQRINNLLENNSVPFGISVITPLYGQDNSAGISRSVDLVGPPSRVFINATVEISINNKTNKND
jgi:hypothetical protein